MKKFALILGIVFTSLVATAQDAEGVTVTVTIENVLSDGGTILAGLHTADTFMKGQGVANAMVPATEGEVTLTFENVQPGTFAVMVMHDKNDNKRMDMEANGMPKESYGMTGPMESYGPPSFETAKFEVTDEDLDFRIRF